MVADARRRSCASRTERTSQQIERCRRLPRRHRHQQTRAAARNHARDAPMRPAHNCGCVRDRRHRRPARVPRRNPSPANGAASRQARCGRDCSEPRRCERFFHAERRQRINARCSIANQEKLRARKLARGIQRRVARPRALERGAGRDVTEVNSSSPVLRRRPARSDHASCESWRRPPLPPLVECSWRSRATRPTRLHRFRRWCGRCPQRPIHRHSARGREMPACDAPARTRAGRVSQ